VAADAGQVGEVVEDGVAAAAETLAHGRELGEVMGEGSGRRVLDEAG
jgi:hypothetical protein